MSCTTIALNWHQPGSLRMRYLGACCAVALIAAPAGAQSAAFALIPAPPEGSNADIEDISSDGSAVLVTPDVAPPYIWRFGVGYERLGSEWWRATAISQNGCAATGYNASFEAIRWTRATGPVPIAEQGIGLAISPDSEKIGIHSPGRWTPAGVTVFQIGVRVEGMAGISDDGTRVVYYGKTDWPNFIGPYHAFSWRDGAGVQEINLYDVRTFDMTPDGKVVVGTTRRDVPQRLRAFRRTDYGTHFPEIAGDSLAIATSADGWRMLIEPGGLIWDPVNGARPLATQLAEWGAPNLLGWYVWESTAISADGRRIVGNGRHTGTGPLLRWTALIPAFCYANCDGSTAAPALNVGDFTCFLQKFAAQHFQANCNNDASLDVSDFTCFLQRFAAGCP